MHIFCIYSYHILRTKLITNIFFRVYSTLYAHINRHLARNVGCHPGWRRSRVSKVYISAQSVAARGERYIMAGRIKSFEINTGGQTRPQRARCLMVYRDAPKTTTMMTLPPRARDLNLVSQRRVLSVWRKYRQFCTLPNSHSKHTAIHTLVQ